jgi:anti-anti-sigma factor
METVAVQRAGERIRVSGELTMHHAETLVPLLLAAFPDGSSTTVQLDLSDVSEIDAAGLQIIMAARREAEQRAMSLSIVAASQAVRDTLELFRQVALLAAPAESKPMRKGRKSKSTARS